MLLTHIVHKFALYASLSTSLVGIFLQNLHISEPNHKEYKQYIFQFVKFNMFLGITSSKICECR